MFDTKTLNSLDLMTKYETYSKYSNVLEEKFKGLSLKSLVKTCKNPRIFIKPNFLEEFAKKYPHENDQFIKETNSNNKAKSFSESLTIKKQPKSPNINPWTRSIRTSTKLYEPRPDPCWYNPNFDSIYKNIPCCIISPIRNKIKNLKTRSRKVQINNIPRENHKTQNNSVIKKNNNMYNSLTIENNRNKSLDLKNDNNSEKVTQTLPAVKNSSNRNFLKNMNKNDKNNQNDRNNHAFKFCNYTPRKQNIVEQSDIVSYIEPHNYNANLKKTFDFGKMQDREKSVMINYPNLENPSSYYYNPKYEYTETRPARTLFTHQDIIDANKKSSKFLIHKLWTSYNYHIRYQLIDNDKLNNNIFKDIKMN